MTAKKLLIVTQLYYPDTFGGSERVVYEQARLLAKHGHEVVVLVHRDRAELPLEESMDGVRIIRYGRPLLRALIGKSLVDWLAVAPAFERLLAEWVPDAVILHHPFPAAGYFRSAYSRAFPSVYVFHASVYKELQLDRTFGGITRSALGRVVGLVATPLLFALTKAAEHAALRRADRIVAFSGFSLSVLGDTYPKVAGKAERIPGGVDLATYVPRPSRRALRLHLDIPEDAALALSVRRLVPRMGLPLLIEACGIVRRRVPKLVCLIGGVGPEEVKLKRLVRTRKLEHVVRFLGPVPAARLPDFYGAADLYVLPTIAYEGLGLTTLEALASGLPVVGTPVGATPEVLGPLDRSLVAAEATAEALAASMEAQLAKPPAEQERLRAAARTYAERHFRWEDSVGALEDVLATLPPPRV